MSAINCHICGGMHEFKEFGYTPEGVPEFLLAVCPWTGRWTGEPIVGRELACPACTQPHRVQMVGQFPQGQFALAYCPGIKKNVGMEVTELLSPHSVATVLDMAISAMSGALGLSGLTAAEMYTVAKKKSANPEG